MIRGGNKQRRRGVDEIEEHEIVNRRGGSGGGIMRRGCKEKRNYKDYNQRY